MRCVEIIALLMDRDGGEPFREVFLLVSATNPNTVAAGKMKLPPETGVRLLAYQVKR